MALIKCTECGCEMSEHADKCPKCGCPTKINSQNTKKKQVEDNHTSNILTNEKPNNQFSHLVYWTEKKHGTKITSILYRYKRILFISIIVICTIILFSIFKEPTIADSSIDKVTPELKKSVQKYNNIKEFSNGLAAVCKDNKWGFIDKLGQEVIPCKYDRVTNFVFYEVSIVESDKKCGIINKFGETLIPLKYDYINEIPLGDSVYSVLVGENLGVVKLNGKEIIPAEYDFVSKFIHGIALACKDKKWGCIDKSNNIIIPFIYDGAGPGMKFSEGLIALQKDGKFGYLDMQGNVVIPFDKKNTGNPFHNGVTKIKKGGYLIDICDMIFDGAEVGPEMSALIDRTGKQVTEFRVDDDVYDNNVCVINGYAIVTDKLTQRKGLTDPNGNLVVPMIYADIEIGWINNDLVCVMYDKDKAGFINVRTGETVIPCEYEPAIDYAFYDGLWAVKKYGKCGFIDLNNNLIIPYKYDNVGSFHEGFAIVEKYGKLGYVDRYGNDTFY